MKILALAAVSLIALTAGPAFAADPLQPPPVVDAATFDWNRAYVGVGGAFASSTTIVETIGSVVANVGINQVVAPNVVVGAEGYGSINWSSIPGPAYWSIGGEVRGGMLATPEVLIYGALGGEFVEGGNTYGTFGGGIEFAATDDLSVDLEYKYYVGLNNPWQGHTVSATANWHF